MVTHPGANWTWHRLTSLIKTNALLLRHTTTKLRDVWLKYFTASSLKDIFETVDNQNIIGFIKDAHFYHQL